MAIDKDTQGFVNTPIQKMVEDAQKDSTVGPLIGSVIIILIIIVGGIYYWGAFILDKKVEIQTEKAQEEQSETIQVEETAKQSSSDDVSSIEADIQSTNIDSLDEDFGEIEKEF